MDLETRVRMLERRGHRQSIVTWALGLALLAVFLMGQASESVITARRIVVQDGAGRERIVLDGGDLRIRGEGGDDLLAFGTGKDGSPQMVLDGASLLLLGDGPATTLSNGKVFLFQDRSSLSLAMQGGRPRLVLGEAQQERAVLGPIQVATSDGDAVSRPTGSLVLLDADGTVTFQAP